MPRPKKPAEFQEGPQAAENFRRLAEQVVLTPRPVLVSERIETTETLARETTVKPRPKRKSK
jgi:hypothetical protein